MMTQVLTAPIQFVRNELQKDNVYLLPLRLFIGIGWIRASLEKIITPEWLNGTELTKFFYQQLSGGEVVFPYYRHLITSLFAPHSLALSWIIMIGQMLVGLAILFGAFTNFALLWGLFMNVNFVLAGMVSPSAFYIVIQTALLVANAGAVFGLDHFLSRRVSFSLMSAQAGRDRKFWRLERACFFLASLLAVVIGAISIPFIHDYSPHSVDDPAMLMLILALITGLSALVTLLQIQPLEKEESGVQEEYWLQWSETR